jgi:hypothetical protein
MHSRLCVTQLENNSFFSAFFPSQTLPQDVLPGMAAIVQDKLNLGECATMDIRSACCGSFQGFTSGKTLFQPVLLILFVAVQYLKCGTYKTICVIGSDVGTIFADLNLGTHYFLGAKCCKNSQNHLCFFCFCIYKIVVNQLRWT